MHFSFVGLFGRSLLYKTHAGLLKHQRNSEIPMQKHTRARGSKSAVLSQTFPVIIEGHQIPMTREQVIANGQ